VSCERIRDELTLMLTEGHARRAFELLDETGLLAFVFPEAVKMHGVEQPPQFHPEGDVWVHTMLLLEKLQPGVSPTLAWGALLHDIGKPATFRPPDPKKPGDRIRFDGHVEVGVRMAEEILGRLRFSNEDTAQIVALVKNHMRFGDILQMRESTLKRFLRLPKFDEHLALHWMDASSAHGDLRLYEFAKEQYEATPVRDDCAEAAGDGEGLNRRRISSGAGVQSDAGGRGRCSARGPSNDSRGRADGREGAIGEPSA